MELKKIKKIFSLYDEIFLMWSGGKDSSASICLCYELGIPVTAVIMSEVMFDNKRNISGENPEHISWVYNIAIPIIEKKFGYKVIVLRDKSDYLQEFNYRVGSRSKFKDRIGKKRGWFIGGMCIGNDRLKMRPIKNFLKSHKNFLQVVGIAYDEPDRFNKKTMLNKYSILYDNKITESMTYDICRKYNLLSPIYNKFTRGGCWFCPNQSIREFAYLKKEYPNLWNELKILSYDKELVSNGFAWGVPFDIVDRNVDIYNNQLSFFDN